MAFWAPKSQSLFLTRFPVLLFFIPLWSQSVKYFKYGADRAQAASTSHCSLLISSGFSKIPVSWFSNMVVAEMTKEDLHARSVFHILSSLKSTFNELHFYICATFLSSAEDYSNVIHAVTWILHIMWVLKGGGFWWGFILSISAPKYHISHRLCNVGILLWIERSLKCFLKSSQVIILV